MDLQLTGKRAVIAGGSKGIGLAAAHALVAEGADVALIARNQETLDEAKARILEHGGRVLAISTDTTDDAAVRAMADRVAAEWGGIDILVNTAAQPATPGSRRPLAELRDEDLHAEIDTKVLGYLRTARAIAPYMIEEGWGRIVNVAGLAVRQAGSTFGTIRNAGVSAITKNLADELGPRGINVTVVHPGTTVTERIPALLEALAQSRGVSVTEVEAGLAAATTIGRMVTAEEVANVIAFLASPLSVAINGDNIAVGGGAPGPIYY